MNMPPNPYLPSNHFFSEIFNKNGKEAKDWPNNSHRVYVDLNEIQEMFLTWHQDGDKKNTPKSWSLVFRNGKERTFALDIGNRIFEGLQRLKGQIDV